MKRILLTEAQYDLLKTVLDSHLEGERPLGSPEQIGAAEELWHACARAASVDRAALEDALAEHWVRARASADDIADDVARVTGREKLLAEDALAGLTDDEVARLTAALVRPA
jgi:hypothetical protein